MGETEVGLRFAKFLTQVVPELVYSESPSNFDPPTRSKFKVVGKLSTQAQ